MIEITKKYPDRIKTSKPIPLEHLEQQLDDLQQRIDERELQFRKECTFFHIKQFTRNLPQVSSWLNAVRRLQKCVPNVDKNSRSRYNVSSALSSSVPSAVPESESSHSSPRTFAYAANNAIGSS